MQKVVRLAIIETIRQKYNRGSLELLELSQETQEKNPPPCSVSLFSKAQIDRKREDILPLYENITPL